MGGTTPERTWMRLGNSASFLRTYINGSGRVYMARAGEKDMESGTGAEEHSSKALKSHVWPKEVEDREDFEKLFAAEYIM